MSTNDQNTALQRNALESAGCELIFKDKISGKVSDRPRLKKVLRTLSEGDTLVAWKDLVDEIGNFKEAYGYIAFLHDDGFLKGKVSFDSSGTNEGS